MKTLERGRGRSLGALPRRRSLPIALLPVQVQTRYVTRGGKPQLLVRVYPDELHLDAHEPAPDRGRGRVGQEGVAARLARRTRDKEAERLAWTQLAERFGARRAEWIARKLRPTNLKAAAEARRRCSRRPARSATRRRPAADARAAPARPLGRARLPGRAARAARGGRADPGDAAGRAGVRRRAAAGARRPAGCRSTRACAGWSTSRRPRRSAWASASRSRPSSRPGTLDTLLVLGVNAKLDARRPAAPRSRRCSTRSTTRAGSRSSRRARRPTTRPRRHRLQPPRPRPPAPSFESVPAAAKSGLGGRGRRAPARRSGPRSLAGLDGAARTDELDARHLQTALWPVTGGYYLDQIMGSPEGQPATFTAAQLDAARRYFVDFVRALGPLPTLRAGRQPYGLLPVDVARPLRRRRRPARRASSTACASCAARGGAALPGVPRLAGRRRPGRARRGAADAAGVGRLLGAARVRQPVLRADDRVREPAQPAPAGPRDAAPRAARSPRWRRPRRARSASST